PIFRDAVARHAARVEAIRHSLVDPCQDSIGACRGPTGWHVPLPARQDPLAFNYLKDMAVIVATCDRTFLSCGLSIRKPGTASERRAWQFVSESASSPAIA